MLIGAWRPMLLREVFYPRDKETHTAAPYAESGACVVPQKARRSGRGSQALNLSSKGAGFAQLLFHPRPAFPCGLFRRARATPVGLQADGEVVAIALKSRELSGPIDDPSAHGGPSGLAGIGNPGDVLAMAMADAILRQQMVAVRVRNLAATRGVTGIPIKHEGWRRHGGKNLRCFSASSGVAREFIFENEDHPLLGGGVCRFRQFRVNRRTIGSLLFKAPEIKTAHTIGAERFRQRDAALKDVGLLLVSEVGIELRTLGAELRLGRARPIHLEQRAADVSHAQFIFFQDAAGLGDFAGVEIQNILVPHTAKLNPLHAEFARSDFAGTPKVLTDFVIDNRDAEGRLHTVNPNLSCRYCLLAAAASFGV